VSNAAPGWGSGEPWATRWVAGTAGSLHRASAERVAASSEPLRRTVVVLDAVAPAVVLGSTERLDHLDADAVAAAGVEVVRRRSGGSAVMVGPQRCVWVDLVIGRADPLWHDDIGRAAWWVGEAWAAALGAVGIPDSDVWRGAMRRSTWSDRACFAGLGPGEVTLQGRKVVGVAQRRTRGGALFQCAALIGDPPQGDLRQGDPPQSDPGIDGLRELITLQALHADERAAMSDELAGSTFPLTPEQAAGLVSELLRSLQAR
jgi:lipoate-protein ligase A